jgi:CheY-like chemotaxis protein
VQLLESDGHVCFEATSGADAMEKVRILGESEFLFDVILMDFVMPQMDGPSCVKLLRKSGYTGMIVGLTNTLYASGFELFKQYGADEVVLKPLTVHGFHEAVFGT